MTRPGLPSAGHAPAAGPEPPGGCPAACRPSPPGKPWLALALIGTGLVMVPWLFVLATQLPAVATAWHWSVAWTGLDSLEALFLLGTGWLMARRDPRCCLAATAAATLIVADAWFDVTTAAPGVSEATAIAMAAFPELPVAALCTFLALRTLRRHEPDRTSR
jgi:hypothetical protein